MDRAQKIKLVAELIKESNSILIITGAGISAESGLPTYRGVGGLYHDAQTVDEMPIEVALSGAVWERDPAITWRHILDIERACRGAAPNAGHLAIAHLEAHKQRVWVLTQNVDGLHRAAGSAQIIPIHGSLHTLSCPHCAWSVQVEDYAHLPKAPQLPACPVCQHVIRPSVILFGEALPEQAVMTYEEELHRGFDLIFSIGTTSQFPYIAHPMLDAARTQTPTVEINPQETLVSHAATFTFREPCAQLLHELFVDPTLT